MNHSVYIAKFQNLDKPLERIEYAYGEDAKSLEDLDKRDIFVLNLQRACQIAIDIAGHLIKSEGQEIPSTMHEYFSALSEKQIISNELSIALQKMVGFRNIAVHDYEKIDIAILQSVYEKHLEDFTSFKQEVFEYLQD